MCGSAGFPVWAAALVWEARSSPAWKERLFLVPTELNLDPVGGYPDYSDVHPNAAGYRQVGASVYAWLKARLQARAGP